MQGMSPLRCCLKRSMGRVGVVGGHHPSAEGACKGWRNGWASKGPPYVLPASWGRKFQLWPESCRAERSSSGLRNVCSLGG